MVCVPRQFRTFKIIRPFLQAGQTIWCLLANFENFGKNGVFCPGWQNSLVSSVHSAKNVWCFLSTVAKRCGVFCSPWQKMPGVFWVWCLLSGSPVTLLQICEKTMIYHTNVDLVNDNVYTKFGLNRSIRFQDIEQKLNSDVNQGP